MDLTIQDVAKLLNVPEKTINRLLSNGKIPAYLIQSEHRFNRSEIEDWVMKAGRKKIQEDFVSPEEEEAGTKLGRGQFILYRSINQGDVLNDIPGEDKETVISAAVERIAKKLELDHQGLEALLLQRERLYPTALGHGIGIPHTRDFLLGAYRDVVVVVYPEKPISYGALDGEPVHTLFFLFACEDKRHLQLLSKIAHLSSFPATREFLLKKPSKQELLTFIRGFEAKT